eukprot:COSAG01_NODE_21847_length_882_cov_1.356322_1_plen_88_part_00
MISSIYPIVIGDQEDSGLFSKSFFEGLRNDLVGDQLLPDVVSAKSTAKAREFLRMLEPPVELTQQLTIRIQLNTRMGIRITSTTHTI